MTSDTDRKELVLILLSTEQREAYAAELERFSRPGIQLKFEDSSEAGLDIAARALPAMIIVGMTIGMLEGLEFVALLMRACPKFPGKIVVLPDKGDPFPAVVQARDPATGKSSTENIDLAGVESLISALAANARPVAPEAAPPPVASPPAAAPPVASPARVAKAPAASPAGAGAGSRGGAPAPQGSSQPATVPAPGPSQVATVPAPRLQEKVARSPAAGARPAPTSAARPEAPWTAPLAAARLAPRPQSAQGSAQKAKAAALASPGAAPVQASVAGTQPSASSAVAPPAPANEARQDAAQLPGPGWLSDALAMPVPGTQEPMPAAPVAPAAPAAQATGQSPLAALFVSEPAIDAVGVAPAVAAKPAAAPAAPAATALPAPALVGFPAAGSSPLALGPTDARANVPLALASGEGAARVPAPALAPWFPTWLWLPKWLLLRGERFAIVVVLAALVALVAAAIGTVTLLAQPSDTSPDTQSAPQNSHK
jgi:hypothetical protein